VENEKEEKDCPVTYDITDCPIKMETTNITEDNISQKFGTSAIESKSESTRKIMLQKGEAKRKHKLDNEMKYFQ